MKSMTIFAMFLAAQTTANAGPLMLSTGEMDTISAGKTATSVSTDGTARAIAVARGRTVSVDTSAQSDGKAASASSRSSSSSNGCSASGQSCSEVSSARSGQDSRSLAAEPPTSVLVVDTGATGPVTVAIDVYPGKSAASVGSLRQTLRLNLY